jgi:hypothetical protein
MYVKEKIKGSEKLRSGELGGQVIGPPLSVHFSGNLLFKNTVSFVWKSGDDSFC